MPLSMSEPLVLERVLCYMDKHGRLSKVQYEKQMGRGVAESEASDYTIMMSIGKRKKNKKYRYLKKLTKFIITLEN